MDAQYAKTDVQSPTSGNTSKLTDNTTVNDRSLRTITGIYVSDHSATSSVQIYVNGQLMVELPLILFVNTRGPIEVNVAYPANQYFDVRIKNGSGSNITNAELAIFYKVG